MEFIIGITLQIIALVIVLAVKKRRWFSSLGVLFVIVSFTLHGVIEVISRIFFKDNLTFRENFFIGENDVNSFVLNVGVAMFIFSVIWAALQYGALCQKKIKTKTFPKKNSLNYKDIILVGLLFLPAIFLIGLSEEKSGYWVNGMVSGFVIPITVISLCWYLIKNNFNHALFFVLILGLSLSVLGIRNLIVSSVVVTLSILFRYGMSLGFRKLLTISSVTIFLVFIIFITRSVIGRDSISSLGGLERTGAGIKSVQAVIQSNEGTFFSTNDIVRAFIGRLDANSFGALMHNFLRVSTPPGFSSVWNNVELIIPKFVNQTKQKVEEESFFKNYYYLRDIDYAPYVFGSLYAYSGLWSLLVGTVFLALLYGFVDRWLSFKYGLGSIIIEYILLVPTLRIEGGFASYFSAFRSYVFLVVILAIIYLILRLFNKQSILEIGMCDKTDG